MKRIGGFYILALAVFVFTFSPNPALAKDDWVRVKSKNFNITGNASEKDIRRVAAKLEQFRETFRQLFPKLKFNSPVPTSVIVFKNDKLFMPYKPVSADGTLTDWSAGYFLKGEDVNYIALSAEGEKEQTYSVIFHEFTHFLVDNDIGRSKIPPWLNEGLAEYYERFRIEEDRKITLGASNNNHLALLERNGFIPFETFFNTDYYTLNRQGKISAAGFYAQSWALTHYLIHGENGARSRQLNAFIELLISGKSPKDAFFEAFQMNYAEMMQRVKKYAAQKNFNVSTVIFKEKLNFDLQMEASPVSESESKAILGDLLYHSRRFDEAAAHFEQSLALNPDSARANMSLGLVKMRQNSFIDAKNLLKKSVELDDKNYLAHYQYAYVLSREKMTDEGFVSGFDKAVADEIKAELKKSIAINPDFAESYALYAFVCAVRNEDLDEAFVFIKKALEISPGNEMYLIRSSEISLRKENFADARAIAQKVFETASDSRMRLYAQNTISKINSTEAQLLDIRNYKKQSKDEEIESEAPISEEELAKRNALALNEALNQALRRPARSEKRALGYITKIECSGRSIEFSVKIENQNMKFQTPDFDSLFLMSYSPESANAEVGCGTIKNEIFAVVTFRPNENTNIKSGGQIVAIEFMPQNFKLIP